MNKEWIKKLIFIVALLITGSKAFQLSVNYFSQSFSESGDSENMTNTIKELTEQPKKTYYATDLGITIEHPESTFMSQISRAHVALHDNECLTTIEFTTAPPSWDPPYFKIPESYTEGIKEEYSLPGIIGINTIDEKDDLSIFYGEISSNPSASRILMVRTSDLTCKEMHSAILNGMSAM